MDQIRPAIAASVAAKWLLWGNERASLTRLLKHVTVLKRSQVDLWGGQWGQRQVCFWPFNLFYTSENIFPFEETLVEQLHNVYASATAGELHVPKSHKESETQRVPHLSSGAALISGQWNAQIHSAGRETCCSLVTLQQRLYFIPLGRRWWRRFFYFKPIGWILISTSAFTVSL